MYAVQIFFAVALGGATSGLVNSGHYVWKQGFPGRYPGCVLNQHELKAGVVVPVLTRRNPDDSYIPSTRIMFVLAVRCRILRGSRYSSQFSHSLARSADSNSSTTMRFGFQSPSSTSVLPPRTMYFPPYFATVGPASLLYSS